MTIQSSSEEPLRPMFNQLTGDLAKSHAIAKQLRATPREEWTLAQEGMLLAERFRLGGATGMSEEIRCFCRAAISLGFERYAEAIDQANYIRREAGMRQHAQTPAAPAPPTIEQRLHAMGVPPHYAKMTGGDFDWNRCPEDKDAYAKIAAWVRSVRGLDEGADVPSILIGGNPGNGKTSLAAISLRAFVQAKDCGGIWMSCPDFLDAVRNTENADFDGDGPEIEMTVERAQRTPILVLDDFGRGRATKHAMDTLFRVLDYRYKRLPIILTTNLVPDELRKRLDPAVWDRTFDAFVRVSLRGKSYRRDNPMVA